MKTKKSLEKIKTVAFEELPSVKKVLGRIQRLTDPDGSSSVTYQGVNLTAYEKALTYLKSHKDECIEGLENCLRNRIKAQDTELLTHAVTLLATNGWERSESPRFGYAALDAICQRVQVKGFRSLWKVLLLTVPLFRMNGMT